MIRRNPPAGYVYLDALAPLYRTGTRIITDRAQMGLYKTAKLWQYEVAESNHKYEWWIISWDEYLEIVNSLKTREPQYYIDMTVTYGPFSSMEEAENYKANILVDIFELSNEHLCNMDPKIYEKDGE